ncbi:MAG: hypothetical protein N4A43_01830 [Alphaproteobacteria bacterium]|jgi:hypothetical protein|nr:hypothetical protein [Alphaproteobacteria bacterium]
MKEIMMLDVFDEDYNHIGVESSDNVHKKGLWHQNFHCWIINPKNRKLLVVKMPKDHIIVPNKLDVALSGQMSAGEPVLEGRKEIEKHLKFRIKEDSLTKIGLTKEITYFKEKDVFHRVFSHSYFIKKDFNLSKKNLSSLKDIKLFEMSIKDGLDLFSGKQKEISVDGYTSGGKKEVYKIKYDDFVPRGKEYLYKVLFMIDYILDDEIWEQKYKSQILNN